MDLIDEVTARFGSLQRPRDPDPEGLGGKVFNHEGHCRISLPGCGLLVGCCTHRGEGLLTAFGGGLRVGGEVGRGRTPVPTILRRLSAAAFLTVVQ